MGDLSLRDILIAGLSSTLSVVGALTLWILNLHKTRAEVERLQAEKNKLQAETQNISSTRLLRELEKLAEINDEQFAVIEHQRQNLANLRTEIEKCGKKELDWIATEKILREEIARLKETPRLPLNLAFPLEETLSRTFEDSEDDSARD